VASELSTDVTHYTQSGSLHGTDRQEAYNTSYGLTRVFNAWIKTENRSLPSRKSAYHTWTIYFITTFCVCH